MTACLLDRARQALEKVNESPAAAIESAAPILDAATQPEVLATAHFACGLAHRRLARGAESTAHLEHAATHAAGHPELLGKILRSLAFNYAQAGNHQLGDRTIEQSIAHLDGEEADVSRLQQAFLLQMRGEHRAALPVLDKAVANFSERGADSHLELTLQNRAMVHMEFGDYDSSIADLEHAFRINMSLNRGAAAATAALHLSQVMGWRDDIPGAMRWHSRSVELSEAAGSVNPVADMEHAYVLIQARLMREAEAILAATLPRLESAGDNEAILVSGRLLLIDVLMEKGDHLGAMQQVELANAETPVDGRWRFDLAAARHKVAIAAGEHTPELLDSMVATAEDMAANGERHAAVTERSRAIELALAMGDVRTAERLVGEVRPFTRSGPLWLQIQVWTALAQLRLAQGNRKGAAAAVRAGMSRLDGYRSVIGATDLRMHAADYGQKLAAMGVHLAVESGDRDRVYAWSERLRSQPATAAVEEHENLSRLLANLRRAGAAARRAAPADAAGAWRKVARLEAEIRRLNRQLEGRSGSRKPATLLDVRTQLGDHTLVQYIEDRGTIFALVADDRRDRLVRLTESDEVFSLIDHLRFSAERIARPSTSEASRMAALTSAGKATAALRNRLIEPLEVGTPRVVVSPSGALFGIPWGAMFDIPVVTAPSAATWLEASRRPRRGAGSLVVSGPGLQHAADEASEIAATTGAVVANSVDQTIEWLPKAAAVHFACHAHLRADSPLFSSLVLDDGALTLYDIERLTCVPDTIVLAACSGAGSVLASGDEVLSLAGSFLAMGARTVVAPMFTVSDELTHRVMTAVYGRVSAGDDLARALLSAASNDDPAEAFTALSFSCYGAA